MQTDYNKVNPTPPVAEKKDEMEFVPIAETVTAKPPIAQRLNRFVFGNEGFSGVARGIVTNVFIPVIKKSLFETSQGVIHRIIYPNGGPSHGYNNYNGYYNNNYYGTGNVQPWNGGYTNYSGYYNQNNKPVQYEKKYAQSMLDTVFEIEIFRYKEQADRVFENMVMSIQRRGRVTLGDYLTMLGKQVDSSKWSFGWKDLSGCQVLPHIQGGYYINLPRPEVL